MIKIKGNSIVKRASKVQKKKEEYISSLLHILTLYRPKFSFSLFSQSLSSASNPLSFHPDKNKEMTSIYAD